MISGPAGTEREKGDQEKMPDMTSSDEFSREVKKDLYWPLIVEVKGISNPKPRLRIDLQNERQKLFGSKQ